MEQARASGRLYSLFENVEGLAAVAAGCGRPESAARLLGAATALRVWHDLPVPPVDRPTEEHLLQRVEAALGQAAFAAAFAAGQGLTLEEAVAEALADEPA